MNTPFRSVLCALCLFVGPWAARADEAAHHAAGHESGYRHHTGVFLGGVTRYEGGHEETGMALGVEYEYRVAPRWGLGALVEGVTVGHGRELAIVAPLSWHPWRGLKLSVGPGVEFHDGNGEFLGRVSAGYEFHAGRWSIAPEVSGDFTREAQSVVYGLAVGIGF